MRSFLPGYILLFLLRPFSSMRSFMVTPLNLREISQRLSPERTV